MPSKIFGHLCRESLHRLLSMVLYSPTRWSSTNYMFCRLRRCKRPLMGLPFAVANERYERGIDFDYSLPPALVDTVTSTTFWRGVDSAIALLDPICKALGALEGNSASMATTYAAFVYVYVHVTSTPELDVVGRATIIAALLRRWARDYSPVHALAFACDPFYFQMRSDVQAKFGFKFLQLDHGSLKPSVATRSGFSLRG